MSERRTKPRHNAVALGRKQMVLELARAGRTPAEIADRVDEPFASVMTSLYGLIGEGALKRSDLVFAFDQDVRDAIELAIEEHAAAREREAEGAADDEDGQDEEDGEVDEDAAGTSRAIDLKQLQKTLAKQEVPIRREDLAVYLTLRDARVALGDMYEMVRDIELALHDRIREAFVREYGDEHWWREGVPANVRAECAALYEHDPDPAPEAYGYTSLIHLREILDKRWDVLGAAFPPALRADRKKLMADLVTLNRIRNAVMHPVRRAAFTDREFLFVRDFLRALRGGDATAQSAR